MNETTDALAYCSELPHDGTSIIREHRGQPIFLIRFDQSYYAYLNRCPHRGLPLDWGDARFFDEDRELLQCASHGALFEPKSGLCVAGPCVGAALENIPVRVAENSIYIHVAESP